MADNVFTETDESRGEWVDVRMSDPEKGEWDVDVVVAGGRVEYVDLRIDPEHFRGFLSCLVEDLGERRTGELLETVADEHGLELATDAGGQPTEE